MWSAVEPCTCGWYHNVAAGWSIIHRDVCEKGYDPERNTFTQSYGSKELDAALLLIPQVGFGVTSHMSESRTDTAQDCPQAAGDRDDTGHGKHRGAAATDDSQSSVHGRHRRPGRTSRGFEPGRRHADAVKSST
jgi:hypothetical protein